MEKPTENQPIDDLFARKLGNMSLPPKADGFERLQTRMGQNKPEARMVIWHSPYRQRYMAAAACFLLICLFSWLYWPSATETAPGGSLVATNPTWPVHQKNPAEKLQNQLADTSASDVIAPVLYDQRMAGRPLATVEKPTESDKSENQSVTQIMKGNKAIQPSTIPISNETGLAQTKPAEVQVKADAGLSSTSTPVAKLTSEQVADTKPTPTTAPSAERVLIVTIAEPESLVAARQAAKASVEQKASVAVNNKSEKETKAGLWQQVKRIKQGELFARQNDVHNDEQGLLSRAYTGLKHSFDKDKSAKQ